jgi:hypothetical protein
MGPFNGFHVQVHGACFRVRSNSSISRIRQWAALSVAQSGDVVFVATKVLAFGGSKRLLGFFSFLSFFFQHEKHILELEGAELLVNDLPDNFVGRHFG